MAQKDPPQGVSGGSFPVSAQRFKSVCQEFGKSGHQNWAAEQFDQHQNEGCKHYFSSLWAHCETAWHTKNPPPVCLLITMLNR